MKIRFIAILLLFNMQNLLPITVSALILSPEVTTKLKSLNCYVTYVEAIDGAKYIIKQYKHGAYSLKVATIICELVALDMAHKVGVPMNYAYILPSGMKFVGKETNLPATLHDFIEGIRFDVCTIDEFSTISLQQRTHSGLTREIIKNMACHKDLPGIVALDTFVGNVDRGRYNYFYIPDSDSFVGIDLGGAFSSNLCEPSCKTMYALSSSDLTDQELRGLRAYYTTLRQLIVDYPPSHIYEKLDKYALESGIFDTHIFSSKVQKKWKRFLERCKQTIDDSYKSAQKLLVALDHVLKKD